MTAHEIHALSGAYAVDALDDVERARFEQHLAVCAECQAEVAGLRETSALLGASADVPPPPALRDRLLAEIRTVRPLPPVVPSSAPVPSTRPLWRRLAVAAAVVAVVGGGVATAVELTRDDQVQVQPSPVDQVLNAADARSVTVDLPGEGELRLVRSVSQGKAVLVTTDMPAPPPGKVYELWLQADGKFLPAGLMESAGDRTVLLEGDAAAAEGAGITVEPAGGSPQPTTVPLAMFDLSRAT